MRNEGHKDQHSVLTTEMPLLVKIKSQYANKRYSIPEEPLNIGHCLPELFPSM